MRPSRVCFVTTFYPPYNFGGDGIAVQRLARGLAKRGHAVSVIHDADAYKVLASNAEKADAGVDPHGVEVTTLRSRIPLLSTLLTQQTGRPVVNAARLSRLLSDGRFDVIVFNNVSLIGGAAVLAYGAGALKVYIAHEHWLVCPTHVLWRHGRERCDGRQCIRCQVRQTRPPQWWRYTGLLERNLNHIHVFVAMSEFSRAKHREFGFDRPMEVLPAFVPEPTSSAADAAPSPHERPYFLFVGRLERIKGLEDALAAFDRYVDADLIVVGDGEHGPALRRMAAANPRVRFVGRLPSEELTPYYRHALALVMPSVSYETFGITVIEAFSHKTPVIARRLGPLPELVESSGGGELFATVDELIGALRLMQTCPERRVEMGRRGFDAFTHRWSEGPVIDQCLRIIENAEARRAEVRR